MKNKEFSLQKYSSMAGVFLIMQNNSIAQAIYTDIEPDIEIFFDGQTAGIDIDNSGTFDFAFLKTSASYEYATTSFTFQLFRHRLWAGPEIITNSIAGEMVTHGAGGSTTYFPYALNFDDTINSDLSFQNWGFQIMAWGFSESDGDWNYFLGKWSPNIDNGYLGVKFLGGDGCIHYGWIRCSTVDSAKTLVIHDFAYETKCETSIKAGDIIGDTSVVIEEINTLNATVYSFGSNIFVNLNEQLNDTEILIFDLSGKEVYSGKLINQYSQIELLEPKGAYIVALISGEKKHSQKIFITN